MIGSGNLASKQMYHSRVKTYHGTPVRQYAKAGHDCSGAPLAVTADRRAGPRATFVMNSTVQNAADSGPHMPCDLSSINTTTAEQQLSEHRVSSAPVLKQLTDTPAKVFARLKAKLKQQNLVECKENTQDVQMDKNSSLQLKMNQSEDENAVQDGQETYVLTLSPPEAQKTWQVRAQPLPAITDPATNVVNTSLVYG